MNKPPKIIYLQDKDDAGNSLAVVCPFDVTWCVDKINDDDAVYVHAPELEKKRPWLWAMRYKLDGHIDHLSLRRTKKHCLADFEASFGQPVTPEFMSGWEPVKVMLVRLEES